MRWTARAIDRLRWRLDKSYDWINRCNTSGITPLNRLTIIGNNQKHGYFYEPTPIKLVNTSLDALKLDPSEFTFIDFGSGKGRVLIEASKRNYKRIIGVEFANELVALAKHNIELARIDRSMKRHIEIVHKDVADFDLPKDNIVCYFFNPFGEIIINTVIERLKTIHSSGYCIVIVYCEAKHHSAFYDNIIFKYHNYLKVPTLLSRAPDWITSLHLYSNSAGTW